MITCPGFHLDVKHCFRCLFDVASGHLTSKTSAVASRLSLRKSCSSSLDSNVVSFCLQAQYNFPYPTSSSDGSAIPAYPVRAACQLLEHPELEGTPLFTAMSQTVSVFKGNASTTCIDHTGSGQLTSNPFTYQVCTLPRLTTWLLVRFEVSMTTGFGAGLHTRLHTSLIQWR